MSGLTVTIQSQDVIFVGDNIKIRAENNGVGKVRVRIDAPRDVKITRTNMKPKEVK